MSHIHTRLIFCLLWAPLAFMAGEPRSSQARTCGKVLAEFSLGTFSSPKNPDRYLSIRKVLLIFSAAKESDPCFSFCLCCGECRDRLGVGMPSYQASSRLVLAVLIPLGASPCKWFVCGITWSPHCSPFSGRASYFHSH